MKTLLVVALVFATMCGCSDGRDSGGSAPDAKTLIIPGVGVGEYRIGVDTMQTVLGDDEIAGRDELTRRGLGAQFEKGRELTGMHVMTPDYATAAGLRVGSSAAEVEGIMGPSMEEAGSKFAGQILSYDGIIFLMDRDVVQMVIVLAE